MVDIERFVFGEWSILDVESFLLAILMYDADCEIVAALAKCLARDLDYTKKYFLYGWRTNKERGLLAENWHYYRPSERLSKRIFYEGRNTADMPSSPKLLIEELDRLCYKITYEGKTSSAKTLTGSTYMQPAISLKDSANLLLEVFFSGATNVTKSELAIHYFDDVLYHALKIKGLGWVTEGTTDFYGNIYIEPAPLFRVKENGIMALLVAATNEGNFWLDPLRTALTAEEINNLFTNGPAWKNRESAVAPEAGIANLACYLSQIRPDRIEDAINFIRSSNWLEDRTIDIPNAEYYILAAGLRLGRPDIVAHTRVRAKLTSGPLAMAPYIFETPYVAGPANNARLSSLRTFDDIMIALARYELTLLNKNSFYYNNFEDIERMGCQITFTVPEALFAVLEKLEDKKVRIAKYKIEKFVSFFRKTHAYYRKGSIEKCKNSISLAAVYLGVKETELQL